MKFKDSTLFSFAPLYYSQLEEVYYFRDNCNATRNDNFTVLNGIVVIFFCDEIALHMALELGFPQAVCGVFRNRNRSRKNNNSSVDFISCNVLGMQVLDILSAMALSLDPFLEQTSEAFIWQRPLIRQ